MSASVTQSKNVGKFLHPAGVLHQSVGRSQKGRQDLGPPAREGACGESGPLSRCRLCWDMPRSPVPPSGKLGTGLDALGETRLGSERQTGPKDPGEGGGAAQPECLRDWSE